jgi:hypothetical protein
MKIPHKLTINNNEFKIFLLPDIGKRRLGLVYPNLGIIKIATHHGDGVPRAETGVLGVNETFWHEITHSILYDMDDERWRDEEFVTQFSRRLALAIESAKFEE